MNPVDQFCFCGLPLIDRFGILFCRKHGLDYHKKTKQERKRIGRYSGQSKTLYGKYEDR